MASPNAEYARSMAIWSTVYVALVAGISWTPLGEQLLGGPLVYVVAASPAVPIAGMMWAVLRLMQRSDEFVRAVLVKRFVISTGVTFVLCAVWGFLESFAKVPHAQLWLVFPIFWAVFGVVSPFVRTSR